MSVYGRSLQSWLAANYERYHDFSKLRVLTRLSHSPETLLSERNKADGFRCWGFYPNDQRTIVSFCSWASSMLTASTSNNLPPALRAFSGSCSPSVKPKALGCEPVVNITVLGTFPSAVNFIRQTHARTHTYTDTS